MRILPVALILPALLVVSCGSQETPRDRREPSSTQAETASAPADTPTRPDTAATWEPEGGTWAAYRTVFVRVVTDSSGVVKKAWVLHSYASPAETDSILALARRTRMNPKAPGGRVAPGTLEERDPGRDKNYLVPYVIPGAAAPAHPPLPASRAELERAGLGPWLAIWDDLLPDWPLETWAGRWENRFYEYPVDQELDDTEFASRGMVSVSPDGEWRIHPFYGVEFNAKGEAGGDADSGYILYRTRKPQRGRQYVAGTTAAYSSAEWLDAKRFVLAGTGEAGVGYGGYYVSYRAPFLCFGHVDSLEVIKISGPPVSIGDEPVLRERLDAYTRERYRKFWEATR